MTRRRRAKSTVGQEHDNAYILSRVARAELTTARLERTVRGIIPGIPNVQLRRRLRIAIDDELARLREDIAAAVDRAYGDGNEDGYEEGRTAAKEGTE